MFNFQLKRLPAWARYSVDAIDSALEQQVLNDVNTGGENIPVEWKGLGWETKDVSNRNSPLIVLEHTRRLVCPLPFSTMRTHQTEYIIDMFYWDRSTQKWKVFAGEVSNAFDGYGISTKRAVSIRH